MKDTKLNKALNKFLKQQDELAKKYGCKVSIGFEGQEVVLADHTKDKKENNQ